MSRYNTIREFYKTRQWKAAREAAIKKAGGLCEACIKKGIITPAAHVHHIHPLTQASLADPKLTTGLENLMALCEQCHEEIHRKEPRRRYKIDEDGKVILS